MKAILSILKFANIFIVSLITLTLLMTTLGCNFAAETDSGPEKEDIFPEEPDDCISDCDISESLTFEDIGNDVFLASDVEYKTPNSADKGLATLDIYKSDEPATKGILVYIHGGSWVSGDKTDIQSNPSMAKFFVSRGYRLASINYRLLPTLADQNSTLTYKDQAQDIAQAIAYLHKNYQIFDGVSGKFVLFGHSSGAHMVSLISADKRFLEDQGLTLADIKGVISSDVHAYDIPLAVELMEADDFYVNNIPFLTSLFGTDEATQLEASPISYVSNMNIAPTLLLSAQFESTGYSRDIPKIAQENYRDRLREAGHLANHYHFDEESHSTMVTDFGTDGDGPTDAVNNFLEFLETL